MIRKLASIRTVKDVQPIPDADMIEKIQIGGWWCVSKKGEFKPGDKCVYFEIDCLLPMTEQFEFLANKGTKKMLHEGEEIEGYRLRTIKLRGQVSQGLALPLKLFPVIDESMDDVSDILNVVHYETPIPSCLDGEVVGYMPSEIHKTDEERIQNLEEVLDKYRGRSFTITEKVDGTSATFFNNNQHIGVAGRQWEYVEDEKNTYWKMFHKYNLGEIIEDGYAFQGEIIGEGIQGNPLKIKGQELRIFYIWDIGAQKHLNPLTAMHICEDNGLLTVPLINADFILDHTMEEIIEMANRKSLLCKTADAEGIVFVMNDYDDYGHKLSFKSISNKYLLGHGKKYG